MKSSKRQQFTSMFVLTFYCVLNMHYMKALLIVFFMTTQEINSFSPLVFTCDSM